MTYRRIGLGGLIFLLFSWAGCDLLEEELDDAEVLAGAWTFEEVRITVDGEERDVTNRLLENIEESDLTFESDGSFSLVLTAADDRITSEGAYRLDPGSKRVTFELEDGTAGTFDYEIRDEGQQVVLASEDVSFLAAMLGADTDDFDASVVERAELVLQQRA